MRWCSACGSRANGLHGQLRTLLRFLTVLLLLAAAAEGRSFEVAAAPEPTEVFIADSLGVDNRQTAQGKSADLREFAPLPKLPDLRELPEFQRGGASWYGPGFHGRRTANGERFDMHALTAAHPTLPFGTKVRVRSLVNGREVEVRITDRGPYSRGRIIDLSRAAAVALDMLGMGIKAVALVRLENNRYLPSVPTGRYAMPVESALRGPESGPGLQTGAAKATALPDR